MFDMAGARNDSPESTGGSLAGGASVGAATAGAGAMVGATTDAQSNIDLNVARNTPRIRMGVPLLGTRWPIYAGPSERSTARRVGRGRQVRRVFGE